MPIPTNDPAEALHRVGYRPRLWFRRKKAQGLIEAEITLDFLEAHHRVWAASDPDDREVELRATARRLFAVVEVLARYLNLGGDLEDVGRVAAAFWKLPALSFPDLEYLATRKQKAEPREHVWRARDGSAYYLVTEGQSTRKLDPVDMQLLVQQLRDER